MRVRIHNTPIWGVQPQFRDLAKTLQKLHSAYLGERQEAEQWLRDRGPAAIDEILALMASESRKQIKRRRIYFGLVAAFCLIGLPSLAYCIYMAIQAGAHGDHKAIGAYLGGGLGGILGGGGGGILGGFAWLIAPSPLQRMATLALTKVDDVKAIGPLAQALRSWEQHVRGTAAEQLHKLLPRLQPSDAGLLDRYQLSCLYRVLNPLNAKLESDLVIDILDVLPIIGDARALPHVESLMSMQASEDSEYKVRQAAERCYEPLKAKIASGNAPDTLLRPAGQPSHDALLRPAGHSDSDEAILLRASQSD